MIRGIRSLLIIEQEFLSVQDSIDSSLGQIRRYVRQCGIGRIGLPTMTILNGTVDQDEMCLPGKRG